MEPEKSDERGHDSELLERSRHLHVLALARLIVRRLEETKSFLSSTSFAFQLEAAHVSCGLVFGALWSWFGPPHDIHDDYKESISYYLDTEVRPRARGLDRAPVRLLTAVSNWKGSVQIELRMPRRRRDDLTLEEGDDLLPRGLREEVAGFLLGFLEGYGGTGRLHDFTRPRPAAAGAPRSRFGARSGKPFDDLCDAERERRRRSRGS